jgi:hypothetical protein
MGANVKACMTAATGSISHLMSYALNDVARGGHNRPSGPF